ncbi:hypothetical protein DESUT3_38700 [Desulfuromonas versatilis]|uniref:Metalloprotease n=1 Tax=Desulfuromonas versatilis TaxID=2802975 RepID=A0ABN6E355_9BACT|nr:DUF6639 family protein [Desulfuromonas versatilis]BCR06801.1 hypothetical protein DESUT3_38700 [Desulfuromonas versatilis]
MKRMIGLVLLLAVQAASGFAGERACPGQPAVLVASEDGEAYVEICAAAEKALAFLGRYALHLKQPVTIDIVEEKIDNHGYLAYGSYQSGQQRIRLMSYAAILANAENPTMYDEPFDRVHYAGVVAHEVAHAVVDQHIKVKKFAMAPQEYLAHATQLAVLPEARRTAIIQAMKVKPWEGGDSVSHIYMAMNPGKFAVKSYLHLTSLAEPAGFIQILLNNNWLYVHVPKG